MSGPSLSVAVSRERNALGAAIDAYEHAVTQLELAQAALQRVDSTVLGHLKEERRLEGIISAEREQKGQRRALSLIAGTDVKVLSLAEAESELAACRELVARAQNDDRDLKEEIARRREAVEVKARLRQAAVGNVLRPVIARLISDYQTAMSRAREVEALLKAMPQGAVPADWSLLPLEARPTEDNLVALTTAIGSLAHDSDAPLPGFDLDATPATPAPEPVSGDDGIIRPTAKRRSG